MMDGATIYDICDRVPILRTGFHGILEFEKIYVKKIERDWLKRDFVIINAYNAHWLALMWIDSKSAVLFDTLSGKVTCDKDEMRDVVFRCFVGMKNLKFLYGKNRIQNTENLTCGEHVIYFLMFQSIFILDNDRPDLRYVSEIVKCAKKFDLTPDEFVWREIYVELKLAEPPVLMNVLNWYECR